MKVAPSGQCGYAWNLPHAVRVPSSRPSIRLAEPPIWIYHTIENLPVCNPEIS
jgi:hypothetical protein